MVFHYCLLNQYTPFWLILDLRLVIVYSMAPPFYRGKDIQDETGGVLRRWDMQYRYLYKVKLILALLSLISC